MKMNENSILKIIDDKGRLTIPKEVRNQLGFKQGDVLKLIVQDTELLIRKVGINDYVGSSESDLESNIHNALGHLPRNKRLQIVRTVLENLERNED